MPLDFIRADERLAQKSNIKGVVIGVAGAGKTSLARTLPEESTLFVDLEAGTLALEDWRGTTIDVRKQSIAMDMVGWEFARAIACWISGPDPSARPEQPYSKAYYDYVCQVFGDPSRLDPFDTVFVDSITVASRLCMKWAQTQPEAFSEKKGRPDMLGAYGLLGREMIAWLTHLQHTQDKNVWLVGLMDKKTDDYGRTSYVLQCEGSKTGLELPGIVDLVMTLEEFQTEDGQSYRALVCQKANPWGYPAKDRSGRLDIREPPDLTHIINKIKSGRRLDGQLQTGLPDQ